jgi:hypothetical protein
VSTTAVGGFEVILENLDREVAGRIDLKVSCILLNVKGELKATLVRRLTIGSDMVVLISCIVKSTVGVFLSWWYSVDRIVRRKSLVEEEFGEGRCLGKVENLPRRLGGLFIKH